MTVIQLQRRSRPVNGENWAQFALHDPETEADELIELEASFQLKRGWNVGGAAFVYLLGKAALAAVGQDVLSLHRFRHRRWERDACRKTCAARDLYAYCLLCLPPNINQRTMPISRLLVPLIARALDCKFARSASFHREVKRDLNRARAALDKPARERSPADKSLLLRYAGTSSVLRA